jgi:nicotinate-nucleotide adenylyltransferase
MNRIGCFGGTFDPVHKGHVALAVAAVQLLQLNTLIVLPVGNPYYRGRMPIASPQQRNAMLELAFADEPFFAQHGCKVVIDAREQHRAGPTYTIDTLIELKREFGHDASLVWIIGSDAFAQLHTWTRYQELFNYAHFAVATRIDKGSVSAVAMPEDALKSGVFKHQAATSAALFSTGTHGAWMPLVVDLPDASSTEARAAAATKNAIVLNDLLCPPVAQFIAHNKLYQ